MSKLYPPGTDNLRPGKFKEIGPKGGKLKEGRTIEIGQGYRLVPTQEKGRLLV